MTKRGEAIMSLHTRNSFKGPLVVEEGRVRIEVDGAVPATSCIDVWKDATVDIRTNVVTVSSFAGQGRIMTSVGGDAGGSVTLSDNGTIYVKVAQLFAEDSVPLQVERPLTVGSGVQVVVTDPENLPESGRKIAAFLRTTKGMTLAEMPTIATPNCRVKRNGSDLELVYSKNVGLVIKVD